MTGDLRAVIAKGSKSFFLASLFFPTAVKNASWVLYRWCRHCDDVIDNAGTEAKWRDLREATRLGIEHGQGEILFKDLATVFTRYEIPHRYAFEHLEGFAQDVKGLSIRTREDVEMYSYYVAGVVGLMMAHIMGAKMPIASDSAKSLGVAMQLTNISRDVREDFENGRIYLPLAWLEELSIDPKRLLDGDQEALVFEVVKRLLARADELYRIGFSGLQYLPFRTALAVSIAGSIYSRIGKKILTLGPAALRQRVYVTLGEKILLIFEGTVRAVGLSLFARMLPRRRYANS